jgi:hypothetical protein
VLPRAAAAMTRGGEFLVACLGKGEVQALGASTADLTTRGVRSWPVPLGPRCRGTPSRS